MANERETRARFNTLTNEKAHLEVENERLKEVIRELQERNTRLCRKLAKHERESVYEKLASCGREAVLNYCANIARGEIEADLRANNNFRKAGCFGIESWCEESIGEWLKGRKSSLLVELLMKILKRDSKTDVRESTNPEEKRAENRFTIGIAMAVAHVYSLVNEWFVFPFSRILLLLVWKFSKSEFLGDAVNAALPGGFGSKRLKTLIDQKAAGMEGMVMNVLKEDHSHDWMMFGADNVSVNYGGTKQRDIDGTGTHINPVVTNMQAITAKPWRDDLINPQCIESMSPQYWSGPKEADGKKILELSDDENLMFAKVKEEAIRDAIDFYNVHAREIEVEIEHGSFGNSLSRSGRENDENANNNIASHAENEIEEDVGDEDNAGGGGADADDDDDDPEANINDGDLYSEGKVEGVDYKTCSNENCHGGSERYAMSCRLCKFEFCVDFSGSPRRTDLDFNRNFGKRSRLKSKAHYDAEQRRSEPPQFENFQKRNAYDEPLNPKLRKQVTRETRKPTYSDSTMQTTVTREETIVNDENLIGNPEKDRLMTAHDLPTLKLNPGKSEANKEHVKKEFKKYANLKEDGGSRYFTMFFTDLGAVSSDDVEIDDETKMVHFLGNGHEHQAYLHMATKICYPLCGEMFCAAVGADNEGFRKLLMGTGRRENHKTRQALETISKVVTASLYHEFKMNEEWGKRDDSIENFLKFLKSKPDDDQFNTYVKVFVTELCPALAAFRKALRSDDVDSLTAARKILLPYLFTRGHHQFARFVLREEILIHHRMPDQVRTWFQTFRLRKGQGHDWNLEENNRDLKSCVGHNNTAQSWDRASAVNAVTVTAQKYVCEQTNVAPTRDEFSSSRNAMPLNEPSIKLIGHLVRNKALKSDGTMSEDGIRGASGEEIFPNINRLQQIGSERARKTFTLYTEKGVPMKRIPIDKPNCVTICAYEKDENTRNVKTNTIAKTNRKAKTPFANRNND